MLLVYTWTWLADDNKWKTENVFGLSDRQTNESREKIATLLVRVRSLNVLKFSNEFEISNQQ